jgi:hypothetical protein
MRTSMFGTAALGSLLLCAASAPALFAFDLTGNWTGKWSCRGFDGAKYTESNKTSTMAVTQLGNTINVNIDDGDFFYNGGAIPDNGKPNEKGEAVLVQCGTDNLPVADPEGEVVRATVKTKLGSPKAGFKAVSIFENTGDVGTCKYSYKRQDTVDLSVPPCP